MRSRSDHHSLPISPDLRLDARRAVWLPSLKTLAVADLHLGYAWVERARGSLMPLGSDEDVLPRLIELKTAYQPERIVVLGDIVHRAYPLPQLKLQLRALCETLACDAQVTLITGNHDDNIERLLADLKSPVTLGTHLELDGILMIHGDQPVESLLLNNGTGQRAARRILMGHEHPAIVLGDGVTTSAKMPCFLVGEEVVVLPAFSNWAGGVVVGRGPFLSQTAREASFSQAVVIMGERLLPLPLR